MCRWSAAKIDNSNFESAVLIGADLSGATITGSNFKNVDFTGANLTGTTFTNTNTKGSIGLPGRALTRGYARIDGGA